MAEPSTAVHDSFGAYDHLSGAIVGEISATNEAIKDRQAVRRLVRAGILPAEALGRPGAGPRPRRSLAAAGGQR